MIQELVRGSLNRDPAETCFLVGKYWYGNIRHRSNKLVNDYGCIVLLRDMCGDQTAKAIGIDLLQQIEGLLVRQVPEIATNTLL